MGRDTDDDLAARVAAAASGRLDRADLQRLARLTARSIRRAGAKAVASGRWASEVTLGAASHLPLRDLVTLSEHHGGAVGPELAERLVQSAARSAALVGAAAGALATVSETTPATWSALPAELVVETLVVVAIEMKLVAELHAVAGIAFQGPVGARGAAIARSWADRRGLTSSLGSPMAAAELLGLSARRQLAEQLRRRLARRAGRNAVAWTPFLAGAAAAAYLNRRGTLAVGSEVASSLGLGRHGRPRPPLELTTSTGPGRRSRRRRRAGLPAPPATLPAPLPPRAAPAPPPPPPPPPAPPASSPSPPPEPPSPAPPEPPPTSSGRGHR